MRNRFIVGLIIIVLSISVLGCSFDVGGKVGSISIKDMLSEADVTNYKEVLKELKCDDKATSEKHKMKNGNGSFTFTIDGDTYTFEITDYEITQVTDENDKVLWGGAEEIKISNILKEAGITNYKDVLKEIDIEKTADSEDHKVKKGSGYYTFEIGDETYEFTIEDDEIIEVTCDGDTIWKLEEDIIEDEPPISPAVEDDSYTIEDYYNDNDLWDDLAADDERIQQNQSYYYSKIQTIIKDNDVTYAYYLAEDIDTELSAVSFSESDYSGLFYMSLLEYEERTGIVPDSIIIEFYTYDEVLFMRMDSNNGITYDLYGVQASADKDGMSIEEYFEDNPDELEKCKDGLGADEIYAVGNTIFFDATAECVYGSVGADIYISYITGDDGKKLLEDFFDGPDGIFAKLHSSTGNSSEHYSVSFSLYSSDGVLLGTAYYIEK